MTDNRCTYVGNVYVVDQANCKISQVDKIREEVTEVEEAWRNWVENDDDDVALRDRIIEEAADLITATCGLVNSLGVVDLMPAMLECKHRNQERGRIGRDA